MVKIKMYGKEYCPYCRAARRLLESESIEYEFVDVMDNMDEYKKIKAKTKCKTVPQIFINKKFIGGYHELDELHEDGQLSKLLKS